MSSPKRSLPKSDNDGNHISRRQIARPTAPVTALLTAPKLPNMRPMELQARELRPMELQFEELRQQPQESLRKLLLGPECDGIRRRLRLGAECDAITPAYPTSDDGTHIHIISCTLRQRVGYGEYGL